ncbi:electron transfer flavoprotein subunit beta/FixA family protein [Glaciimonas sp. GNP009]
MSLKKGALKRLAVLVSVGRHPVSGIARYSRNDAAAMSMAVALAQSTAAISLDIIHAGNPDNAALSDYLALGAKPVKVIALEDDQNIIPVLKQALENYDLILCGSCAEGGEASGMVPYLLASQLGLPIVADVIGITPDPASASDDVKTDIMLQQFLPKGRRRAIAVTLPALLTVHPLAPSNARYAHASLQSGAIDRHKTRTQLSSVTNNLDQQQAWRLSPATARPLKLVAQEKRSGHARMLSATVAESRGGRMIQEGSASEKAQAILTYLREHRLVDY